MNLELNNKTLAVGGAAAVLLVALILFGTAGLITLVAMFLFFFLPAYLFIGLFDFSAEEKIFFSFCLGLGFFPLVVWYVNRVIPSLRVSLIVTFILVMSIGILLRVRKKKMKK